MHGLAADLAPRCDPARFERVRELHTRAFRWEPQGYIPLGLHVVDPAHGGGDLDYAQWLDPEPFLEVQTRQLADTLAVGSDLLPVVALNHLGEAPVTSLFGAEQFMPESGLANLNDVGPTPLAVFDSLEPVRDLRLPGREAGIMPAVERMARRYREALPPWVHVAATMPSGPFSAALELRGSDFILDLVDEPELSRRLMEVCAQAIWQVERQVREITGEPPDRHVSNFGTEGVGLRLGEDSIVNLSPQLIRDFCLPVWGQVNRWGAGRGHVHFCSLPHARHEYLYPALTAAPEVAVVSSQFGFEYYREHLESLRGRLAVESFYGDARRYVTEHCGSFRDWAREFVPRFRDQSGLVLYCNVGSAEEGRELWAIWQEVHRI